MALLYEAESYAILGACFEVYKEKGCGFLEPVYQECLAIEFADRRIPFREKFDLHLTYKKHRLKKTYECDYVCFDTIIVEIKAVAAIDDAFRAQVHNYLKATDLRLGLLINFGHHPQLEHERIIR